MRKNGIVNFYINYILYFSYSVHQIVKGPSPQPPNLDIPTESKASKVILPSFSDNFTNCELPEITIEDIKDSNDKILFYTGLSDCDTYKTLFECLIQQRADKLVLDYSAVKTETDAKKGRAKRKLRIEDVFFNSHANNAWSFIHGI